MADAVTFRNALIRCGITQEQALAAIPEQGYTNMVEFSAMSEEDVLWFVKAVNKLPAPAGGDPPPPRPSIPFASIKKLKAMRNWTIECRRMGVVVVHNNFTAAEMQRTIERMDFEADLAVNKPELPELPEKFISFGTKWRAFIEGLKGHCSVLRGCMNIPIAYVYRETVAPTAEQRAAAYDSSDARLMALVLLEGREYRQDNHRLWDLIRPLVYGTAAWDYVKGYDRAKNGRMAVRVLERRGEGDAAMDARRAKAEDILQKASYTGKSKRFTLQSYINLLQGAFTELEECGDPYSERKKVDTFVKGLTADRFMVTRQAIIQNEDTRNDFQQAYAFVETMEQYNVSGATQAHDGFDRNVSGVERKQGNSGNTNTSWRSPAEWAKLTPEERAKIQSKRDKDQSKKRGPGKGKELEASKRKLAELASDVVRAMEENGEAESTGGNGSGRGGNGGGGGEGQRHQSGTSPGDQFGRQAHAVTRFAKEIHKVFGGSAKGGSQE